MRLPDAQDARFALQQLEALRCGQGQQRSPAVRLKQARLQHECLLGRRRLDREREHVAGRHRPRDSGEYRRQITNVDEDIGRDQED